MKMTKLIAAATTAAILASSAFSVTSSAFDPYFRGEMFDYTMNTDVISGIGGTGLTTSTITNKIPKTLYMTSYASGAASRKARVQTCIDAAEALLAGIDHTTLNLPVLTFSNISIRRVSVKYDDLAKINAENGSTILTFNKEESLKTAMSKIKDEEQSAIELMLKPFRDYIDSVISGGDYTDIASSANEAEKNAKISNAAILASVKKALSYAYSDSDLFTGDTTDETKLYQTVYLSAASTGNTNVKTAISNEKVLKNFPRFVVDDNIIDWDNIEHISISKNANNSWWFAVKDGDTSSSSHYNALSKDYCWLKGMLVPRFAPVISFGADSENWQQYEAIADSSASSDSANVSIYYNSNYNYASDYVYVITDGTYTYCYPNLPYADAACSAMSGFYLTRIINSSHSASNAYFCFLTGQYYSSLSKSPYPRQTVLIQSGIENTAAETYTYYYIYNDAVYDYNGKKVGTLKNRGYTTKKTWFCIDDGKFYASALATKHGYYVSTADTNTVSSNDEHYQYWQARLEELEKQFTDKLKALEKKTTNQSTSSSSSKTDTSKTTNSTTAYYKTGTSAMFYIKAKELADIRANYKSVQLKSKNNVIWTINSKDIGTPAATNLRVIYTTQNVPKALRKAMLAKNNVEATCQFTIGENVEWCFKATAAIKLNKSYSNYIATLYRYDTKTSALVYVSETTVAKDGRASFSNIDHGGDFLVTLG